MSEFVAGDDPADHTVAEVLAYLTGDEVTGDEHDRVVESERAGRNRVGIMSGSGVEEIAPDADPDPEPEVPETDAEAEVHEEHQAELTRAERNAKPVDYTDGEPKVYTPDEALRQAQNAATEWVTSTRSAPADVDA